MFREMARSKQALSAQACIEILKHTKRGVLSVIGDDGYAAVLKAVNEYGHFENVYETIAGCTVSCHCGPGTLGVLFVRK